MKDAWVKALAKLKEFCERGDHDGRGVPGYTQGGLDTFPQGEG
jgi:hypothetical protein